MTQELLNALTYILVMFGLPVILMICAVSFLEAKRQYKGE